MNLDLGALALEFAKAKALGTELDAFLASWAEAHPSLAPDIEKVRAALAAAVSEGNLLPVVSGALAGALHAILAGHGEQGKHSAHMG